MATYDLRVVKDGTLTCSSCKQVLPVDMFHNSTADKNTSGKVYHCKECISKKQKERRLNTKGFKTNLWNNLKSNAKRRNLDVCITKEDIDFLYNLQNGLCAVTGLPMEFSGSLTGKNSYAVSVDRIDSNLHYTKDNIRLVCARVNLMKMELEDKQLEFWCKQILNGVNK